MESFFSALLLGILEGLTEFIPVSSTGHLILAIDLLGLKMPPGKVFEIVIQLGAILAICWVYRVQLFGAVWGAPSDPEKRQFLINILLAFIPSAIVGVTLHDTIKSVLFDPVIVAVMLVVGGFIILAVERYKPAPKHHNVETFSWKLALKIGLCQAVSVIPGTSRSGATIMGAMLLGVDRKAAAEFSFFLAIPTMLSASAYDLYKNADHLTLQGMEVIAIGTAAAFFTAMLVIKAVLTFISTHGFVPFAYYRIAVGSLMLALLLG